MLRLKRLAVCGSAALLIACSAFPANAQRAGYAMQWQEVGGPWKSLTYFQVRPGCGTGNRMAVACPGQGNYRGRYVHGQTLPFWKDGCGRPAIQIKCTVTPLH